MKKLLILGVVAASAMMLPSDINAELLVTFRPENVMLPSTQWSGAAYDATVWVCNNGESYYDRMMHNHIWGVPDSDANGRKWFDPEYELTGNADSGIDWQTATGPFRSDPYYMDHVSFQWTTNDITADFYMRRSFTLDEIPPEYVYMAVGHDDGPAEFYINGVLVFAVRDGWNENEVIMLTEEQKSLLKGNGEENLIAVHVHQNWGGAFADCGLYRAEMNETSMLIPSGEDAGPWECEYFYPIDNYDLEMYETTDRWYDPDSEFAADAEQWTPGFGPFANDENSSFCATYWDSSEYPIMIRRRFELTAAQIAQLKVPDSSIAIKCSYDEYPRFFLNGEFICSWNGWNDNRFDRYLLTDDQKSLLKEGENLICVSLCQGSGGGHIDFGLEIAKKYVPGQLDGIEEIHPGISTRSTDDSRIFDMQGRYVGTDAGVLSPGIYVRAGSKFVVRKE